MARIYWLRVPAPAAAYAYGQKPLGPLKTRLAAPSGRRRRTSDWARCHRIAFGVLADDRCSLRGDAACLQPVRSRRSIVKEVVMGARNRGGRRAGFAETTSTL